MSLLAAFFIGSLAATTALTVAAEHTTCPYPVSCPCGSSSKNYTFCFNSPEPKNPCVRWSRCARCENGLSNCAECHTGYTGPTCGTVSAKRSRVRRQYSTGRQVAQSYPTYSESCPELEAPKLGAIRCVQSGRYRTCTGRCLPGYTFKNMAEVDEVVLRCRRGSWQPSRSFPPCENRGLCDLELKGSGTFNCTTGMLGTRCDIICGDDMTRRHFCYPGKQWEPPLPYCIQPKDPKVAGTGRTPPCRCENGGSCDASGRCICPVGRTGRYCETVVPEKQYCPDPGFIADGERRAGNGQLAENTQTFEEGQSVVFSCTGRGSALVGSSLLTCTSNGSWSASLPHCLRPTVSRVTCPDPGSVTNADRLNTDGSSSVNVQTYRVGQSVVYTCHRGYALHGPSMLTCQQSSKWSSDKPYCTRVGRPPTSVTVTTGEPAIDVDYCPDPGVPRNGDRTIPAFINPRVRGFQKGSRLEYSCKSGFELVGEKNLFCQLDATWSSETPTCLEKASGPRGGLRYCDNPGPMFDGKITVLMNLSERRRPTSDLTRRGPRSDSDELQYPQGTKLEYSCDEGFALRGPYLITCEATGKWSANPPSCVEECGRTFTQTIRKITNGMKTVAGEWPWVVAIAIQADNESLSQVICGGALLDKRTVVTAAHCLTESNRFTLYFGKYHILEKYDDEKVLVRTSTQLITHPRFNSETYNADIALVRFSPSIRYSARIQPICLPTRETTLKHIKIGQKGYVTGWGLTEKNLQSDTLLMAHLPVLPTDSCKRAYERQGLPHAITDNMFCAGFEEGVVSACTGDSGSPLVFYDIPSDRYTLEGIVSFGVSGQCGLPGRYTAFTFVSKFVQWIIRNM